MHPTYNGLGTSTLTPTLGTAFDKPADLAHELADLARAEQSATLASVATDALTLAAELRRVGEHLATLAGVPERRP